MACKNIGKVINLITIIQQFGRGNLHSHFRSHPEIALDAACQKNADFSLVFNT